MNDRELEQQVRDAFDSIKVPEDVQKATLVAIEAARDGASSSDENKTPLKATSHRRRAWRVVGRIAAPLAACLIVVLALFGVFRTGDVVGNVAGDGVATTVEDAAEDAIDGDTSVVNVIDLEPTAFVDIDINPSIQLQLNRDDEVIGAQGINDDGTELLGSISIDGMPYAQALRSLMASDAIAPYLSDDPFIALSVSSGDQSQERALTDISEQYLASVPYRGSCHGVSLEYYEEAHSHGMGCARYSAAVELLELDSSLSIEDCSDMSMRELRDRIDACTHSGGSHISGQGGGMGQGSNAGQGGGMGQGSQGNGMGGHHGRGAHHAGS